MKVIKRVLGHLFFGYAVLLFVITMLIVFIPILISTMLPEPRASKVLQPIFRVWMGTYLPLIFCPVFRKGKEHFKKGENYVVVSNHNSFADVPVTSPWIPGPNKTLAKVEITKAPIFGTIYKAGSVLVDRKSENSRRDSMLKMQQVLGMGINLCLYPEGTRNKTGKPLQPFYDGAFITAVKAQKNIIPAIIFNTGKILPHNKKAWAWPMPIRLHFLPEVSVQGLTLADVPALKDKIHKQMEAHFIANER